MNGSEENGRYARISNKINTHSKLTNQTNTRKKGKRKKTKENEQLQMTEEKEKKVK